MRPLIGITCSRKVGSPWGEYDTSHTMDYTFSEYSSAIAACGGSPVIIPASIDRKTVSDIVGRISGLLLSGGPDVNPKFYGEQPLPGIGEIDEPLDEMELTAARLALESDIPTFGICRGIQVMNVALGGTLYQDIATHIPGALHHRQSAAKSVTTHEIRVEKECLLRRVLKRRNLWVNGKHHQAVKDVADVLKVSALAPDGVIEAVEAPGKTYVMGVQWHPEANWRTDTHSRRLFQVFVNAAKDCVARK